MKKEKPQLGNTDLIDKPRELTPLEKELAEIAKAQHGRDDVRFALRKMITLNLVGLLVVVISLVFASAVILMKEERETIAMSPDGRVVKPVPLSEPFLNTRTINSFADEALFMSFSLDAVNYRQQLTRARPYFTPQGYKGFEKSINTENWLARVITDGEIMNAKSNNIWVIGRESVSPNGRYYWDVQSPVTVEFSRGKTVRVETGVMTFRIVRVSNIDHPFGVAVHQVLFQPTKS